MGQLLNTDFALLIQQVKNSAAALLGVSFVHLPVI